jgi:hypothetical protein
MLAEGRMSSPEPTDHPAQVLAAYLLLALRHDVLNQTVHLRVRVHAFGDTGWMTRHFGQALLGDPGRPAGGDRRARGREPIAEPLTADLQVGIPPTPAGTPLPASGSCVPAFWKHTMNETGNHCAAGRRFPEGNDDHPAGPPSFPFSQIAR